MNLERRDCFIAILAAGSLVSAAPCQCANLWNSGIPGSSSSVDTIARMDDGSVIAGFDIPAVGSSQLERWDGASWSPFAMPLSAAGLGGGGVTALTQWNGPLGGGRIVAAGTFDMAGTVPVQRVAAWDGVAWQPLGSGLPKNNRIRLAALPAGELVAGIEGQGIFYPVVPPSLLRWNGTVWSAWDSGNNTIAVTDMLVLPSGSLLVAYASATPGTTALRLFDGTTWQAFPPGATSTLFGAGGPRCLTMLPTGQLLVAGSFTTVGGLVCNRIAMLDMTTWTWSALGTGRPQATSVSAIETLPNGDIVVGESAPSVVGGEGLARWDGVSWSSVAGGLTGQPFSSPQVTSIAFSGTGELLVGGYFAAAGGFPLQNRAVLETNWPATTAPSGAGCGNASMSALSMPWTGARFEARTTGLPVGGLGVIVWSASPLSPSLPLSAVLPSSIGCDLHVNPEVLGLELTPAGSLVSYFDIPATPAIAGVDVFHQVVGLTLGPAGIVDSVASNALQLTVGCF